MAVPGVVVVTILCLISVPAVTIASASAPASQQAGRRRTTGAVRVPPNDSLTPRNLARLRAESSTARDLFDRLDSLPDMVIIVRAHPLLVRNEQLLGRGRFWVVNGILYGLLEYQAEPYGSHRVLRVLAHELAHALEIGVAPRVSDTAALRSMILELDPEDTIDGPLGIETEFARAVAVRVRLELLGRLPNVSGLNAEAFRSHLTLPPPSQWSEGRDR